MLENHQDRECFNCFIHRRRIRELEQDIRRITNENLRLNRENDRLTERANRKRHYGIPKGIRLYVYSRSLKNCEVCGSKAYHIHHKDRDRKNNNADNLIHLCLDCHKKEHKRYIPTFA